MTSMGLLDLPPEILQEVLKETVTAVGIYWALRLRLVSKVFDPEVIRAIFTTRLIQEYSPRCPNLVGVPLVAGYLEARTLVDATNTKPLISVIRQISDTLLLEGKEYSEESWRTNVNPLCKAATEHMGCFSVIEHLNTVLEEEPCQEAKLQDILAAAVYLGQFSRIKDLLNSTPDDVGSSEYFGAPIQLAAGGGHEDILITLLEHEHGVSSRHLVKHLKLWYALDGWLLGTALQMASSAGHNHIVKFLQESKYIDRSGHYYGEALQQAALRGHSSTVQILLDKSTSLHRMRLYEQILYNASAGGHVDIVRMMLDLGTNVNAGSAFGTKAIHCAARWGHHKVIEILLAWGAEQTDSDRGTPLCEATRRGFTQAARVLIDHGANLDDGWPSPLTVAAKHGQAHMVQLLIDKGVDLGSKESSSMALCTAAENGRESVVRVLIEAGLDVDGGKDAYMNPLIHAIISGQDHMARFLVKLGASRVEPSKSRYAKHHASFILHSDEHMAAWQRLDQSLLC